jgi:hypothetical protein
VKAKVKEMKVHPGIIPPPIPNANQSHEHSEEENNNP